MASWIVAAAHVLTFTAWGVSGLVALLLAPGNPAARRLALAGILLVTSRVAEHLLVDDPVTGAAWRDAWLPRYLAELAALGALAAVVATLAVFPDGSYDRRWHRHAVRVLAGAVGAVGVLRLIGSPRVASLGDGDRGAVNPYGSEALGVLGTAADAIAATEPAWIVLGVVILVLRYRRGPGTRRAALRWPLGALLLPAAWLALVVVGLVLGVGVLPESPLVEAAFLVSLALFPLALLVAVVNRVRGLEAGLVRSRTRLVEAEDAARRRVERDLHDGVQQQLAAVLSLVELAQRQLARDPALAAPTLTEIAGATRDTVRDLREVVGGIHPAVLTDRGLVEAVEARLQRLALPATLTAPDGAREARWDPAREGAAYFVVCELLTNVVTHAGAGAAAVDVECDGDALSIAVRDDGRGFAPDAVTERGLLGVRDRVESLGGSVAVASRPGHGTVVRIRLPGGRS